MDEEGLPATTEGPRPAAAPAALLAGAPEVSAPSAGRWGSLRWPVRPVAAVVILGIVALAGVGLFAVLRPASVTRVALDVSSGGGALTHVLPTVSASAAASGGAAPVAPADPGPAGAPAPNPASGHSATNPGGGSNTVPAPANGTPVPAGHAPAQPAPAPTAVPTVFLDGGRWNTSFEGDSNGWTPLPDGLGTTASQVCDGTASDGNCYLEARVTNGSGQHGSLYQDVASTPTVGKTYTLSVYMRRKANITGMGVAIYDLNASNGVVQVASGMQYEFNPTSNWTRVSVPIKISTAGGNHLRGQVFLDEPKQTPLVLDIDLASWAVS